jgi:hypothetical protein
MAQLSQPVPTTSRIPANAVDLPVSATLGVQSQFEAGPKTKTLVDTLAKVGADPEEYTLLIMNEQVSSWTFVGSRRSSTRAVA